ncbi:MAG: methylmalonyl Co-A mutase-associated GTPase MeaB, partial [Muribaculaceae bacterium]|nr:methylmalonyl Co-A mutase-associated GTPase MeaB [Muribaculaceae bacterium]
DRARLAAAQFRNALHLFPPTPSKWRPEVVTYSGYFELDVDKVWDMIDRYFDYVDANGYFERKRQEQEKYWMIETINEQLRSHFYNTPEVAALLEQKEIRVLNSEQSSFMAAKDVLDFYFSRMRGE